MQRRTARPAQGRSFPELGAFYATPSFTSAAAEGTRPSAAKEVLFPMHVTHQCTVLIDFKTLKRVHTCVDCSTFLLEDLKIPGDSVTALYMVQVEQLFLVTFPDKEVYKVSTDRHCRVVP